jgi:hypothetical protein
MTIEENHGRIEENYGKLKKTMEKNEENHANHGQTNDNDVTGRPKKMPKQ